jgi:hypothetical protein
LKIHYPYRRWSNLGEHGMKRSTTWREVGPVPTPITQDR